MLVWWRKIRILLEKKEQSEALTAPPNLSRNIFFNANISSLNCAAVMKSKSFAVFFIFWS
jgi:hypothetical protein